MLADGANGPHSRLSDTKNSFSPALPLSLASGGKDAVPLPPAMPGSAVLLQLLLSSHVADLHAITEVIRNDIGLVVRVLRMAGFECGGRSLSTLNMGDLVVQLGVEKLKGLLQETPLIPMPRESRHATEECERFWTHARLTAGIADGLAGQTIPASREAAYVAGLLHRVGVLPILFGWEIPGLETGDESASGYALAKAWHLPKLLADVILGDPNACNSRLAYSLLNVVSIAEERASQLETLRRTDVVATQAWC
jgi:HD-like signal output (HDOD) protein